MKGRQKMEAGRISVCVCVSGPSHQLMEEAMRATSIGVIDHAARFMRRYSRQKQPDSRAGYQEDVGRDQQARLAGPAAPVRLINARLFMRPGCQVPKMLCCSTGSTK